MTPTGDGERRPGGGGESSSNSSTAEGTADSTDQPTAAPTLCSSDDPDERLAQATAYLEARGIDDPDRAAAIAEWLTPLPQNRLWANRRRSLIGLSHVGPWATIIGRAFSPPAGTQPQPLCAMHCFRAHAQDQWAS